MTDASTGATTVWTPPQGQKILSNTGATALVRNLPLQWEGCCDDNGDPYWLRKVVEPTPVFANGRLYYLVSVIPNSHYLATPRPVDQTVIVDAEQADHRRTRRPLRSQRRRRHPDVLQPRWGDAGHRRGTHARSDLLLDASSGHGAAAAGSHKEQEATATVQPGRRSGTLRREPVSGGFPRCSDRGAAAAVVVSEAE